MKSRSKKSIWNLSTALVYKLLVIAVGLILPKLFLQNYGMEIHGLQSSVKQFFVYIALLEAGVGTATLQSLYKPVVQDDRAQINAYLSAASRYYNRIGFVYFGALVILSVVYALVVPVDGMTLVPVMLYVLVSGAVTGFEFFYVSKVRLLLKATGEQYWLNGITTLTFLISSALKIYLIWQSVPIVLVECVFLLIHLLFFLAYWLLIKRKYPWLSLRAKPDYSGMEQKNAVLVHRITSVVFLNIDVVLLTLLCDLKTVSIYAMYKMVMNMVSSILAELTGSFQFLLGQQFNGEEDEQKPRYCRMVDMLHVYYSAVAFAVYTVTYLLILPFLRIYTSGLEYDFIFPILPVFYIVMEFLMVGREMMLRTIDVAGHFRKTQGRAIAETVLNLVFSILFVVLGYRHFGPVGGICGVLGGTILALLYRTLDINHYVNRKIFGRRAWKTNGVMLVNLILFVAVAFGFRYIPLSITNYAQFVLHGCWITAATLLLFLLVQSLVNRREWAYLLAYVKAKRRK